MSAESSVPRIWVISDTHLTNSKLLPAEFTRKIDRKDVVLHLGDIITFEVWEFLTTLCRVEAVSGNCDMPDVRRRLKPKKVLELGGFKIGMTHGHGGVSEALKSMRQEYENKVDVAMFGHTHIPCNMQQGDTLFFNPGSLKNARIGHNSYGVLHLDSRPWAEVIEI